MEIPFGFLHFAEHDSPLNRSIFSCFVMFSNFVLPLSMAVGSSVSFVNVMLIEPFYNICCARKKRKLYESKRTIGAIHCKI